MKKFYFKLSLLGKLIFLVFILGSGYLFYTKLFIKNTPAPQYQTAVVERGTLISSITSSGQVSSANTLAVTTQATGVIKKLYVKEGDRVKTGQKIAEIELDLIGRQNSQSAYASYLAAKNSLTTAQNNLRSAQASLAVTYDLVKGHDTDESLTQKETRTKSEVAKDNAYLGVVNAQAGLSSSWLKYQQASSVIYAPISGTITGLSLQPGAIISSSETKIANIKTDATPIVSVNLTEIDSPKIKVGNKATITFDAFPEKTFTGKVVSIDTAGSVSSGVTNYPATLVLDTVPDGLHPNMSSDATIIIFTKPNVILVPSAAILTQNNQSTVRVQKNNQIILVNVETGASNDTQTEIISGLNEGDVIITSIVSQSTPNQSTRSIFGGGFGGGTFRMAR